MSERSESDAFLSRGLSSVIRRHRARVGSDRTPSTAATRDPVPDAEPVPNELADRAVVGLIARGGVGLVYRVSDRELGRELAVKVLSQRYASEPEMVARFEAEARICAQLQHPGIVPIHETGRLADGRPYFTMKVVEGETLAALLTARTSPEAHRRRFVEIFERICQTLAYVHAQGVVHGDLKPSNVMVGAFGEVQVMDWGFARQVDRERGPTCDGSPEAAAGTHVLGTPAYMAPEQARGDEHAITSRTDVFGLGAILCEVLTGRPPYAGDTRSATYLQATQGWQEDAQQALRDCGDDATLVALASRCLAPDANRRPRDATAVADEVAAYLEGLETRAQELQMQTVAAEARAAQERRSRRIVVALGAALLLAVVAAAGTLAWLQDERSNQQAQAHRLLAELVERGRALADRARASGARELLYWEEAQAALLQAQQLASSRLPSTEELDGVTQLLDAIRIEASAAQRRLRLVQWAEQMRPHYTDDRNAATIARGYRAGFARFGFSFSEHPDAAAEQIRTSAVAPVLCAAVDDWARIARNRAHGSSGSNDIDWRTLVDIARRADPHPFRDRLRLAFRDDRLDALQALTSADELRTAAAATWNLLGKCLFDLGATERAIEVLRAAAVAYPDDFWILHDLAVFLRRQPDPPTEEILGLCRAAVALRPSDPHALCDFAHALAFLQKRWQAAGSVVDRVRAQTPKYTRSWFPELLVLNGKFDQALAAARTNAKRSPESLVAHDIHGWTAHVQGRAEEAARAWRRACQLAPKAPGQAIALASALADLRDLDAARTAARAARQHASAVGGSYTWSANDEMLATALELTADPDGLAATAGWPNLARGIANHLTGNSVRGARELNDWLGNAPATTGYVHFAIAARAALAAARTSEDPKAAARSQLDAARFLEAAVSSCARLASTPASSRRALAELRWLQADPSLRRGLWSGDAAARFDQLQQSMRALAGRLIGR